MVTTVVILKATGKGMGVYKYCLLHELVWNYLFDSFMCLWIPIELFPLQCSYSAVGKVFAIFVAITYRYSQVLCFMTKVL
ncbi:unnamed protein product [Bursaphelenchus okinawaensis]|uniref:Uncharacterized protein n=1 Tax=Bursaphelenchus okinawaensis TaxID=465554 RepID=A0A811KTL4_9BILA|nr:unnamed protein product [Bursaphelenchus okinawaensis]CAG9113055.1 unnamed protein product [Bursaphelenchus okinawaensis]